MFASSIAANNFVVVSTLLKLSERRKKTMDPRQITGVENMTDRPDIPASHLKEIKRIPGCEDTEDAVKKFWQGIGDQIMAVENGKVTPR